MSSLMRYIYDKKCKIMSYSAHVNITDCLPQTLTCLCALNIQNFCYHRQFYCQHLHVNVLLSWLHCSVMFFEVLERLLITDYSWSVGIQKYSTTFLLFLKALLSGESAPIGDRSLKRAAPGSLPAVGAATLRRVLNETVTHSIPNSRQSDDQAAFKQFLWS